MVGKVRSGGGSAKLKKITGTWTGAYTGTMVITGIPFEPKAYAVQCTGDPPDGYSRGQCSGLFAQSYSYNYSRSKPYDGWTYREATPPRNGLWNATFANGTLTITSAGGAFGYSSYANKFNYVIVG